MSSARKGAWDAIVVGSGMGGLTAAAALARAGQRVLVLERHQKAGGLTQTFERDGFRFNVGMQGLGGFGPGQPNQRLIEALVGDRLKMARVDGGIDRVSFPGLSIAFDASSARFGAALANAFPAEKDGLARYVEALDLGQRALDTLLMGRCGSPLLSSARTWLGHRAIERWVRRTTRQVVDECVTDARARAVLCARWGDYGTAPGESSFALHAAITRRCMDGAWYPEGGPGGFARELTATVTAAGGEVRTGAAVMEFAVQLGQATGVRLTDGEMIASECVISDIGIRNTLRRLPSMEVDYHWARDGYSLDPSVGAVVVYLGLEGDIAAHGATPVNEWIYDTWNVDQVWRDPESGQRAPALFVSFTSLRDPAHVPGPHQRHVCEMVAPVDWSVFARWDRSNSEQGMRAGTESAARSASYLEFKATVERRMLTQFHERFPELTACVRHVESSSPVSLATFTGAEHGATYGLQTTPQRFLSQSLRPRTPIRGLFLAGQDVATPGIMGAAMGGMMAAASIEPGLWKLIRG
jgi:all-trans-retinol 13,14-reductase